jgi:rubrerythrin
MFLIFGVLMLVDGIRNRRETTAEKEGVVLTGWMSRHVIQHAAVFEEAAAAKYSELAAKEQDREKRELYLWLAKEESAHLHAMKAGLLVSEEDDHISVTEEIAGDMPPITKMHMEGGEQGRSSLDELQAAIENEMAQVQFYEALAKHCKIPRLKDTFHALASAEQLHVDKLRAVLGDAAYGRVD